ncbi:hypothetical protein DSM07_03385 [Oenococcus sp. UCMA 16435]|nr:hypothetical protein DSM07_03385 [Oenococcus sp. UCMA 16435]MDN6967814.1 hypothetical protein [Oenococcus sp. UCMA 17063]
MNIKDKNIVVINASGLYTTDEIKTINKSFDQFDVEFVSLERRSAQNSLFSGLQVIISGPVADMLFMAIVIDPLYDLLKSFLTDLYKRMITKSFYFISGHKKQKPDINVHIPFKNQAQIIMIFESKVPVSDQLLDQYFLKVQESVQTIQAGQKKIVYMKNGRLVTEDEAAYILYLSQQPHQDNDGQPL